MRTFSLLLCLLCLGAGLRAQQGLKIGLRFSPIFASASITDENGNDIVDNVSTKPGISYGLMANYGLTDNYGFHSGIHIVQKGFKRTENVTLPDTAGTLSNAVQNVRLTTVEIPLALKGRSPEVGRGFFINGLFGASVDITAGYKNEYSVYNPVTKQAVAESGTTKNSRLVNPLALSFIFGLGGEYEMNIGTLNAGFFYHRGLTNVNNRSEFGNNESIRVNYLSLDLGYYF